MRKIPRYSWAVAVATLLASVSPRAVGQEVGGKLYLAARQSYAAGLDLLNKQRTEEAAAKFLEAADLDPTLYEAHYGLGRAYVSLGKYDQAVEAYAHCLEGLESQGRWRSQAEQVLEERRQEKAISTQFTRADLAITAPAGSSTQAGQPASNATDHLLTAQAAQATGARFLGWTEPTAPIDVTSRPVRRPSRQAQGFEITPAEVALALGSAHLHAGRTAEAERQFRAALAADPKLGAAHNNLAIVCLKDGRASEASRELQLAEKAGFKPAAELKQEVQRRAKSPTPPQP